MERAEYSYEEIKKRALYKLEHCWDEYVEQTHALVIEDMRRRRKEKSK